jgi:hypothetical protein
MQAEKVWFEPVSFEPLLLADDWLVVAAVDATLATPGVAEPPPQPAASTTADTTAAARTMLRADARALRRGGNLSGSLVCVLMIFLSERGHKCMRQGIPSGQ